MYIYIYIYREREYTEKCVYREVYREECIYIYIYIYIEREREREQRGGAVSTQPVRILQIACICRAAKRSSVYTACHAFTDCLSN